MNPKIAIIALAALLVTYAVISSSSEQDAFVPLRAPDVTFQETMGIHGERVPIDISVWVAQAASPCVARLTESSQYDIRTWLKDYGLVPRSVANKIAGACAGRTVYLSSTVAMHEGTEAGWVAASHNASSVWAESTGPNSATAISLWDVQRLYLGSESSVIQLTPLAFPSSTKVAPHADQPSLTREQVIEARRNFQVEVLSFDNANEYGVGAAIKSTLVRIRVTNNSNVVLPVLTPFTQRWDSAGERLGSSRMPKIPTGDLKPGQSAEFDYYALGAMPGTARVTIEIEQMFDAAIEEFIEELPKQ